MTKRLSTGGGTMGAMVRAHDWGATPLGPADGWPHELISATSLCLHSAFPAIVYWGPEFRAIYNDAYIALLGARHPCLGEPGAAIWPDSWPEVLPHLTSVIAQRTGMSLADRALDVLRDGARVRTWWASSYTPILDGEGAARGIVSQPREITGFVHQRRHDALMLALDAALDAAGSTVGKMDAALTLIGRDLEAGRVGYSEIDHEAGLLRVARCWTPDGMIDIRRDYPLGTFGRAVSAQLRRGEPVLVDDVESDPRTSDPATLAAYRAVGARSGMVVPILDQGDYVGGIFVQDALPRQWTVDQGGRAAAAARRLWRALARSRAETRLRDSERRYRLIFEQAHDIIFTADLNQKVTACNPAAATALGWRRDEIVGRPIADFISPDDHVRTATMLRQKLAAGGDTQYEVDVRARDGRVMRWEINSTLAIDRDGAAIGLQAVARDVTERRVFDERRELLINELNHRVKNTLSLVQALARQSFGPGSGANAAEERFFSRIAALSSAHDLLTRDQWEGAMLASLVDGATRPIAGSSTRIDAAGPALTVPPKVAISLTMALHELTTNAVKYGALSTPEGRVVIRWSRVEERFTLVWHEQDGPPVTAPKRRGFGLKMIERALASDLGGRVTITFDQEGLRCAIDAPLPPGS